MSSRWQHITFEINHIALLALLRALAAPRTLTAPGPLPRHPLPAPRRVCSRHRRPRPLRRPLHFTLTSRSPRTSSTDTLACTIPTVQKDCRRADLHHMRLRSGGRTGVLHGQTLLVQFSFLAPTPTCRRRGQPLTVLRSSCPSLAALTHALGPDAIVRHLARLH